MTPRALDSGYGYGPREVVLYDAGDDLSGFWSVVKKVGKGAARVISVPVRVVERVARAGVNVVATPAKWVLPDKWVKKAIGAGFFVAKFGIAVIAPMTQPFILADLYTRNPAGALALAVGGTLLFVSTVFPPAAAVAGPIVAKGVKAWSTDNAKRSGVPQVVADLVALAVTVAVSGRYDEAASLLARGNIGPAEALKILQAGDSAVRAAAKPIADAARRRDCRRVEARLRDAGLSKADAAKQAKAVCANPALLDQALATPFYLRRKGVALKLTKVEVADVVAAGAVTAAVGTGLYFGVRALTRAFAVRRVA